MEEVAYLFSGFFFIFIFFFYIALIVGGVFLWYFIIKKAIVKGIEQSVLNKDQSQYEREIYLLKLEVDQLKALIKSERTPVEIDEFVATAELEARESGQISLEKEDITQIEAEKHKNVSEFDEEKE